MGVIGFLLLGLIAGAIAKAVWRGDEPGGLLGTMAVGTIGALLGGMIASLAGLGGLGSFFNLWTWLVALGGAFLFLFLFDYFTNRNSGGRTATS